MFIVKQKVLKQDINLNCFFTGTIIRTALKMATSPNKHSMRPFTVCIEGNIGSGKTTFLDHFKKFQNTAIIQEPVELWRDVAGANLLVKLNSKTENSFFD